MSQIGKQNRVRVVTSTLADMKYFTNAGLFMLAPAFLIASDFVVTRFSQTGPKQIVQKQNQHLRGNIRNWWSER